MARMSAVRRWWLTPDPWRWAAITLIAAVVAAIASVPTPNAAARDRRELETAAARRFERLTEAVRRAEARADAATALQRGLRVAGAPGTVVVDFDTSVTPRARESVARAIRESSRLAGDSTGRVVLIVTVDKSSTHPASYSILPEATDGRTCISMLRLPRGIERADDIARRLRAFRGGSLLGACTFVLAFGTPGQAARSLLAVNPVWILDGQIAIPPTAWQPATRGDSTSARSWIAGQWWGRWTAPEIACGAGDLASCEAIMAGRVQLPYSGSFAQGVTSSRQRTWGRIHDAGFLAAMAYRAGPERFGLFWRSDAPPHEAFRAATGEPIEVATQRFYQGAIGYHAPGVGLPARAWLYAAIGTLGFLGLAVVIAPRQVRR